MDAKPRLIYVGTLGHSGTTLLDLLLNAHSRIASAGELKTLQDFLADPSRRCTCGATPLRACPFWAEVFARVEASGYSPEQVRTASKDAADLPANVQLLRAIASVSGADAIVDSSKSLRRLMLLLRSPDLDVLPVIMVRDPRGQIWSTVRKGRSLLDGIKAYNLAYFRAARRLRRRKQVWIRYEDLVEDPAATIRLVLEGISASFEPSQLDWSAAQRHNINGNRMRFASDSPIVHDDSWRTNLTPAQQLAIRVGTFPARWLASTRVRRMANATELLRSA